jgi:DNA polymerase I - 3''-5'' exonuclease and polymerase domains
LVFEVRDDSDDQARSLVREEMEAAADLAVPLVVRLVLGPSWFEAH